MKVLGRILLAVFFAASMFSGSASAQPKYLVGVGDVLSINILQPEKFNSSVTVSPDGSVTCPYVGSVHVRGLSVPDVQEEIQSRLADGYMKYPVVVVTLEESKSQQFFVYGEVVKPGAYALSENTSILRGISMAGGFTKFGSVKGVRILRPRKEGTGYEAISVNLKAVMEGNHSEDTIVRSGDIIVVSDGAF